MQEMNKEEHRLVSDGSVVCYKLVSIESADWKYVDYDYGTNEKGYLESMMCYQVSEEVFRGDGVFSIHDNSHYRDPILTFRDIKDAYWYGLWLDRKLRSSYVVICRCFIPSGVEYHRYKKRYYYDNFNLLEPKCYTSDIIQFSGVFAGVDGGLKEVIETLK